MTIADLAGEAYDAFERKTRDNGDAFVSLKDDAPEWISNLVQSAHEGMFPDDWRYDAIQSALGSIHDADAQDETDLDDHSHEWADGNVDIYNANRSAWLASRLERAQYVDDACEELGHHEYGVLGDIGLGQYAESMEVFQSVAQSLRERAEEIEDGS